MLSGIVISFEGFFCVRQSRSFNKEDRDANVNINVFDIPKLFPVSMDCLSSGKGHFKIALSRLQ